jgi:hypothetical protein
VTVRFGRNCQESCTYHSYSSLAISRVNASAYPATPFAATAGNCEQIGAVQNELPGMLRCPMPATHDGLTVALRYDC